MFAVIKTGGKQYAVAADRFDQDRQDRGEIGEIVTLSEVLMLDDDTDRPSAHRPSRAHPWRAKSSTGRDDKVIAFENAAPEIQHHDAVTAGLHDPTRTRS